MRRREALFAPIVIGQQLTQHETKISIIPASDDGRVWAVGVQASQGDLALVQVFYEDKESIPGQTLLRSDQSPAPVVRSLGYGATDKNFMMPLSRVKFIRVKLLQTLTVEEFK